MAENIYGYGRTGAAKLWDVFSTVTNEAVGTGAYAVNTLGQKQLDFDTKHMQLQLERDTDEFLQGLEQRNDYENFDKDLNDFLQKKRNGISDKNSAYYARNANTAEAFDNILQGNSNALKQRVASKVWNMQRADNRVKLNNDLTQVMNREIMPYQKDKAGNDIEGSGYNYSDRQKDAMALIASATQAGYFNEAEADELFKTTFSENLTAQTDSLYYDFAQKNPNAQPSEIQKMVDDEMKKNHLSAPSYKEYITQKHAEEDYKAQKKEYDRKQKEKADFEKAHPEMKFQQNAQQFFKGADGEMSEGAEKLRGILGASAIKEPEKPKTFEEKKAVYAEMEANGTADPEKKPTDLFDATDRDKALKAGTIQAQGRIEKAQIEQNNKYIMENEKLTTAFYKASAQKGGMSDGDYNALKQSIEKQIDRLESNENNFTMREGDRRSRIRELYLHLRNLEQEHDFATGRRSGGGGGSEKEIRLDYNTFMNQCIDMAESFVKSGQWTAEQARQFVSERSEYAKKYGRGTNNEVITRNGVRIADMSDDEKLMLGDETDKIFSQKITDKVLKIFENSPYYSDIRAQADSVIEDMKANPKLYTDGAMAKFDTAMTNIYFDCYNKGDIDYKAIKERVQFAKDCLFLEGAEKRMLMPSKDGEVETFKNDKVLLFGENYTNPTEKNVATMIKTLEDINDGAIHDRRNGKDIYLNDAQKKGAEETASILKAQFMRDMGIGKTEEVGIAFKKNGTDPTFTPQFEYNGNVYELRAKEDEDGKTTGYEVYNVTKKRAENTTHKQLGDEQKDATQKAKQAGKETKETEFAKKYETLTTGIEKDLNDKARRNSALNQLAMLGISEEQYFKMKKDGTLQGFLKSKGFSR